MWLFFIPLLLFLVYAILIAFYRRSWRKLPVFTTAETQAASTTLSVIIPARNESNRLPRLLTAIREQTYPAALTEIIVVDDHSTDDTAQVAAAFSLVRVIRLQDSSQKGTKKKALAAGIEAASGKLIITTDADCLPGAEWLHFMASFYEQQQAAFIAAPVRFTHDKSLLSLFQVLDFISLQGITGASVHRKLHSMCNGANLAYPRTVFQEVGGFSGIDQIASGDDMLLMHKISAKMPERIFFLKAPQAIVDTAPAPDLRSFFQQRIRWASKAKHYDDKRIFWVLLLVYLFNLSFLVLLVAGCWRPVYLEFFLLLWIFKTIAEFGFVKEVAQFFGQQQAMRYFFLFQPFHILYTIIAGWLGQFGRYEWKGRRLK